MSPKEAPGAGSFQRLRAGAARQASAGAADANPKAAFLIEKTATQSNVIYAKAGKNAWIADLLPAATLSEDPAVWVPPTATQLGILAGKHSATGASNADAAKILGMTPQNFRRFTSVKPGVSNQTISYSAWHYLLSRLGVRVATIALGAVEKH